MEDSKTFPFALQIGRGTPDRRFDSLDDITAFLNGEIEHWVWLQDVSAGNPRLSELRNQVHTRLSQLNSQTASIRAMPEHARGPHVARLVDDMHSAFSSKLLLPSDSLEARFVSSIQSRDKVRAAYALAYFVGRGLEAGRTAAAEGALDAYLWEQGIRDTAVQEKLALDELRNSWADKTARLDDELRDAAGRIATLEAAAQHQAANQATEFRDSLDAAKKDLAEIETTYNQKLALQAPVKYWLDGAASHRRAALLWGLSAAAFLLAGGWVLLMQIHAVLGNGRADGTPPENWRLGLLLLEGTIVVWAVRIVVRAFLSRLHLATDSRERAVMVQVFLSLQREGTDFRPEDRTLILNTLFRPAATGIVKDDSAPSSPAEILSRALTKQ